MSVAIVPPRDRGLPLLLVVALLAGVGALSVVASSSPRGPALSDCLRPAVHGAELSCDAPGRGHAGMSRASEGPLGARAWLVGQRLDLNRASAGDLARIPGVGKRLARAIVVERERRGGFRTLDEVDDVRGVGPAKLKLLSRYAELPASR